MSEVVDVEFNIEVEDYLSDRQSVYGDWRDDPRWDAITAMVTALFPDCAVDISGKLTRPEGANDD